MIDTAEKSKPRPDALRSVREARRLELKDVGRDLEVSIADLSAFESGEEIASRSILKRLAKHYAVPVYFFYIDDLQISKTTLPDFRSPHTTVAKLSGSLAASVTRAYEMRDIISEAWDVVHGMPHSHGDLPSLSTEVTVKSAARQLRSYLKLDQKSPATFESSKTYMDWLRARTEYAGIITVFESLDDGDGRGYCIAHDNQIPFIVINTANNIGQESRIFTLMHELVHVSLRQSGVSDPFATRNNIERFCNRVSAEILMPEADFLEAAGRLSSIRNNNQLVRTIAEEFKVSQQASALRLEETEAKPEGFYRQWLSQFTTDFYSQYSFEAEKQIRISKDIGKKKIAKYGTTLPILLHALFEHRFLSALDIRRISGIKPKYLVPTYNAATRRLEELGLNGA